MSEPLHIEGLTVSRGAGPVVRDVTIEITPGEVTALLGPNGAGKSSLVLAVGGVLPAQSGTMTIDGRNLLGRRPERVRGAGVAIVPEGRRLLPGLTVGDNLDVATYSLSREEGREGRAHALEMFPELREAAGHPGALAVGRRAADARAGPGAHLQAEVHPRR